MEILLIIILAAFAGVFAILYFLLRKEIKNIAFQLNIINRSNTNSNIKLLSSVKAASGLALEINKTLDEKRKSEIEHKRMDTELRQAIANMSHDLRTPLTSIMGYIQLMEDDNLSSEEKKEYADIVKKRAESLQILISSFYDLSRLEAKEYKFELKSLNLANVLYDLIASFYKDFSNKNIEPIIDVNEKAALVIADENAVIRIFSNLLQNALKYGDKCVFISLKQDNDYVITTFTNDAPDLSEEDSKHLFERFFTVDRTRTGASTGLGLAITKQLVEQMGHNMSIELSNGMLSIIIKWKTLT
ncbi:sensor histidine kinase [Proteiniborus sp. DW1]|uniref:sensor histidine kinase n=1 Tax=Proteiniborus sp. DW1 TaxID=1889883 RepID=UPI00092E0B6C|nr:HAMP domain-containing sensor histidine kinase [Proteiniborus sp. DW1]SCG84416.1 sensor histidine kinase [Proteiniborus sp. DW1]